MKKQILILLLLFACTQKELDKIEEPQKTVLETNANNNYYLTHSIANSMENTSFDSTITTTKNHALPKDINYIPKGQYNALKAKVKMRQAYYQTLLSDSTLISNSVLNQARKEITDLLLQEIFPFWYGTEWDFNGYTDVPKKGEIACGYLVSTTLRDAGFRLNRYHMAQQASYFAAISLQKKAALTIYRGLSPESLKHKLIYQLKAKPGLYFIGLDNHVGYLLIHNKEQYFIHSNYLTDRVMIQRIEDSMAFDSSIYVIADITYNDALIDKWIRGKVIPIKRG